jgi:hypothetical protein
MDTLYINYIVEGTLELDSDDLKGINNLNKAIKYNLKHISRSLIKTLQLLNDTENTPTYYHSLDVYDPEKVIQDLVFLNVISQCISDKSIQEAVLSFKGVKDMREKLKSNFSSVTNSAFTGVYGVVSTTRLVCEGYIKIPDSLIEFIKLLATTPMAESVNENSKQVKLKPQFKELSDKVYSVCQDYRAQEYILSNPEN